MLIIIHGSSTRVQDSCLRNTDTHTHTHTHTHTNSIERSFLRKCNEYNSCNTVKNYVQVKYCFKPFLNNYSIGYMFSKSNVVQTVSQDGRCLTRVHQTMKKWRSHMWVKGTLISLLANTQITRVLRRRYERWAVWRVWPVCWSSAYTSQRRLTTPSLFEGTACRWPFNPPCFLEA